MAYVASATFPNGWLNFELSVLRRLKFSSIALPFTGEPNVWRSTEALESARSGKRSDDLGTHQSHGFD